MNVRKLLIGLVTVFSLAAQAPGDRGVALRPGPVAPVRRIALLIGNDAYPQAAQRLLNAANDAKAMGAVLQELEFEVQVATNLDRQAFDSALATFVGRLGPGTAGLFFYAGHGLQVDGENYLLPTDFKADSETAAKYSAIPVGQLHDQMLKSGSPLNLIVLDACRDNPFRASRGGTRGLAPMNSGKGSLLVFATAPGQTASDNPTAGNGLFTSCLLEVLRLPDLDLEEVFKRTREQVALRSGDRQIPWTSSSVVGTFLFRDWATQQRKLAEERQRLEQDLLRFQAGKHADAAAARQTEAQLQDRKTELDRRLKELEQTHLTENAQRLEARREATKRRAEQDRQEANRLESLRAQLETARLEAKHRDLSTRELAQAELARLKSTLADAKDRIAQERTQALKQLPESQPKDEFESTSAYQQRQAEALATRNALAAGFEARQQTITQELARQIKDLEQRTFACQVEARFHRFDAELSICQFRATVNGAPYWLQSPMSGAMARQVKALNLPLPLWGTCDLAGRLDPSRKVASNEPPYASLAFSILPGLPPGFQIAKILLTVNGSYQEDTIRTNVYPILEVMVDGVVVVKKTTQLHPGLACEFTLAEGTRRLEVVFKREGNESDGMTHYHRVSQVIDRAELTRAFEGGHRYEATCDLTRFLRNGSLEIRGDTKVEEGILEAVEPAKQGPRRTVR